MQVNDALIDKLGDLAKLQFAGEERTAILGDLSRILTFVEKINELDTDGVEPLIHITEAVNRLRDDLPAAPLSLDAVLRNAPDKDTDYIRSPKPIERE